MGTLPIAPPLLPRIWAHKNLPIPPSPITKADRATVVILLCLFEKKRIAHQTQQDLELRLLFLRAFTMILVYEVFWFRCTVRISPICFPAFR